jgi:2-keto-4-pentenoate hydratase
VPAAERRADEDVHAAALELDGAERNRTGVPTFSSRPSGLTEDDAWRIAAQRDRLRAERGEIQTGYKLGWTSEPMRRALGIEQPNFGAVWSYMHLEDGILDLGRLIHPKAEPEIAFVADSAVGGAAVTADDIVGAGRWAVALEIVDPRWATWEFDWLDNTADGSSAAAYVLGPLHRPETPPELFRLTMRSGTVSHDGTGAAAMGSPAAAVAWLVRQLHGRGETLEPDLVVLTGGITAPVDLRRDLTVHVASPELGSCDLRCV